jgi:hypothetical protein
MYMYMYIYIYMAINYNRSYMHVGLCSHRPMFIYSLHLRRVVRILTTTVVVLLVWHAGNCCRGYSAVNSLFSKQFGSKAVYSAFAKDSMRNDISARIYFESSNEVDVIK